MELSGADKWKNILEYEYLTTEKHSPYIIMAQNFDHNWTEEVCYECTNGK